MKKSIGELIDELTIVNMKIWECENIKHKYVNDDQKIANATRKTNKLNPYRNKLIDAINNMFNDIILDESKKMVGQEGEKFYGES